MFGRYLFLVFSGVLCLGQTASAQSLGQVVSPILIVDRDALFTASSYGTGVTAQLEAESAALSEQTRKIEQALEEEEQNLTVMRETMTAEEFRALADAFDEKVVALRADRDAAQSDFVQRIETAQIEFYSQIGPILAALMQERGAVALLDKRSVLLSINGIDVTEEAIVRIDQSLDAPQSTPGVASE